MHYTLKDHQGSLTATICGDTVERLSYDAWGRRRNPVGFNRINTESLPAGTYTLRVTLADGKVFTDKVVKE